MSKLIASILLLTLSLTASASPLSDAMDKANRLNSSYAVISFLNPNSNSSLFFTDVNDSNYAIGFNREGRLKNTVGEITSFDYGSGFLVYPDGSKVPIINISGTDFKPIRINNSGTIVGIQVDPLSLTKKLAPVVSTILGGFETIDGIPSNYDGVEIIDLNQNGTILLNASYFINPTEPDGLDYINKTFLAKRGGSENRYIATEVPFPLLDFSTLRPYTAFLPRADSKRIYFSGITGYISLFLTDDEIILGDTKRGGGFSYKENEGMKYLYPGNGPVDEDLPIINSGSIPKSLSLPQTFLSLDQKLVGIQTQSELVNYSGYRVNLRGASSDGKVVGILNTEEPATIAAIDDNDPGIMLQNDGSLINLECALPNSMGVTKLTPNLINSNGVIYGSQKYNAGFVAGQMILVRNPQVPINNYCVKVSLRYLGSCGNKKIDKNSFSFRLNAICSLEVTLKDVWKSPVRNAKIKLLSSNGSLLARSITDRFGQAKLTHRIGVKGSSKGRYDFRLVAPYDNKNYRYREEQFNVLTY